MIETLVSGISVGVNDDGSPKVEVTYLFEEPVSFADVTSSGA